MKFVYLACDETLPGSDKRRVDAFEHDLMMSQLLPAASAAGCSIIDCAWDDTSVDWRAFDAVLIGTTWDYCDRYDEYLSTIKQIHAQTPVFNSPDLVDWNSDKNYLRALAADGVRVIPTEWVDDPKSAIDWDALFTRFNSDKLVIKRQIGANAEGQILLKKGEDSPQLHHPVMIQPFLNAVQEEGEYSLIFIDGQFSHALIKQPATGDYRIQSAYGGIEIQTSLAQADIDIAQATLAVLHELPLYARVDMLRDNLGILSLIELELIEPFLYPQQGPNMGLLLIQALMRRLEQQ